VASGEFLLKVASFYFLNLHSNHQNIHAIGDYANSVVLDAFEAALKDVDVTMLRPRLEHAQILREEDMIRMGRLGGASSLSQC
jgi:predicted amidohydrolase YtcJ